MRISQRSSVQKMGKSAMAFSILAVVLTSGARETLANPNFYDTSAANASQWSVTANVSRTDTSDTSLFLTTGFNAATAISGRTDWIADVSSGSHGGVGNWTQFVFRQAFDLTGYDSSSAILKFRWAADDSGEGVLDRGQWTPKYRVNDGSLINGSWS